MWNHFVIQVVFSRIKTTYYIASSVKNSVKKVSDFSDSQFFEKKQKLIGKLPKRFANCQNASQIGNCKIANSNPGPSYVFFLIF